MSSFPNIRIFQSIVRAPGFAHSHTRYDAMKVINKTGSDIAANSIVALSGYDSTTKYQKIVLANALTSGANRELFVTRGVIKNGSKGTVWKGFLATGLNTNAATVGDAVYLDVTNGAYVLTTPPSSPLARIVQVGFVQVKSSTAGEISFDIHEADSFGAVDVNAGTLQVATGTISSANITGTGAGQLGHAQGFPMVPAPGAGKAIILDQAYVAYTFATAAYGGGGNVTVNWGSGGAALTGLVSAANSFAAASSKQVQFYPLSTAGVATVSNASINLVAASAFTQPGTAAGTIAYTVWYSVVSPGF